MIILGIHDGHVGTAALLIDGKIAAMASEERFSRKKNQGGPPVRSIAWVLACAGMRGSDVDAVAVATLSQPLMDWEFDRRQIRRRILNMASFVLPGAVLGSRALVKPYVYLSGLSRGWAALDAALRQNGIPPSLYKNHCFEHHGCHAATAYYLSPGYRSSRPVLVITADASGDGLCATVGVGHRGRIERLHSVPSYHSIGELYTRVTDMLGMKPMEHEYKVMGLAPYAPAALAAGAHRIFSRYYRLTRDGLSFQNTAGAWGPALSAKMMRDFAGVRFDGIAAGVQKLTEEIMAGFILAWVKKTGVRSVAVAGGLFMNVKLNMLLSERPEIEELFLMPSCGDESVCLGAALLAYAQHQAARSREISPAPLSNLFLGPEFSSAEILEALDPFGAQLTWAEADDIEAAVARNLAQGKIIGRFTGRMEWGARSLGNRAILADPRDLRNVRRLNAAIKKRDFWMPFAPSLLHERSAGYLVNERKLPADFMINAFRATPLAERDLPCGLHPADLTCRPQIVLREENPAFHHLISEFEKITGVGGVINTSFNLHGEPIVCTPSDALRTFVSSGLDQVALGKYLVSKRS